MLPSSANNFVVLIPDEGHHGPGEADEARFIAQSFVSETTVINEGTNVIWFNSDVGHEHNIVVTNDADSLVRLIKQESLQNLKQEITHLMKQEHFVMQIPWNMTMAIS
ncbi:MAG: hypothetical protein WBL67_04585 [Nitrososphaeraceae archaeon]